MKAITNSLLFCLLSFSGWAYLLAGDGNIIKVDQIVPQLNQGYLTVSADFQNLFSEKIIGTIQSGLPSIVQIEIKLVATENKQIVRRQIVCSISYNIWQERYSIIYEDTAEIYSDFTEARKRSSHLKNVTLITSKFLNKKLNYNIQIRVSIIPISSRQSDKINDWLLDPNQTEESLASDERASGFKLNLSNLVSLFVGGKKRSRYSSDWYSSKTFRISDLQ